MPHVDWSRYTETVIVCASCGKGNYSRSHALLVESDRMRGMGLPDFVCTACGVEQMWDDFTDDDECELWSVNDDGLLTVVSAQ